MLCFENSPHLKFMFKYRIKALWLGSLKSFATKDDIKRL
ncbi:hypothetical protein LD85_0467 [Saccharolobus islandicus L.D.8.5]|uniref:Uncharacterized protein n=1 Tax=Saccharolobus islandicus (strain L.D.8.5 / Lassen \|nr:hypothetical protein LD85_0467 [Sulfolobus islandicus L.D.8.5]